MEGDDALVLARSDDVLGLAIVAACEDEWEKAARLLGASVEMGRAEVTPFRTPASGLLYLHYVELVARRLGPKRARRCRTQGKQMSAADAFAYGLAPAAHGDRPAFEAHGDVWALSYRGECAHVKDSKGIRDLARLIATPGEAVSSIDLARDAASSPTPSMAIDARARESVRARISALDGEIEDAERAADTERAARARAERDGVLERLAADLGIRGRPGSLADAAESARKTVSTRIRDAIRRIDTVHADLGDHLRAAVRTGIECVYDPSCHARRWTRAAGAPAVNIAPDPPEPNHRPTFDREGGTWRLGYQDITISLPDSKGLGDLARLVAAPGRSISAADLADRARSSGADETIDARARAAYRARLDELDCEARHAEQAGDLDRAARARAARDEIGAHLRAALGVGGRSRRLGDPLEAARKTVSAGVRDAVARIETVHPPLGAHLRATVHMGRTCVYEPPDSIQR